MATIHIVQEACVHVASLTRVKVDAVIAGLPLNYTVHSHEAKSGVNEQPVGLAMIERGALNRLASVKHLPCVAFETGMVLTQDGYYDISCAILRTHLGDFYAWSQTQKCPLPEIDAWLLLSDEGRRNTTLGSIIEANKRRQYSVPPPSGTIKHDWYTYVGGQHSRKQILTVIFTEVWIEFVRTCQMMSILDVKMVKHNAVDFIDIQHNLLQQPADLAKCVRKLANGLLFDVVVVADARGFLLAGEFMKDRIRVVMARKPGKLPNEVHKISYAKEYGTDEICIEVDAIPANSSVIIVDDVLASGGTMRAIQLLVEEKFQSKVVGFITPFAIEKTPGTLLCDQIPLDKIRFAQTQFQVPKWECKAQQDENVNEIAIIPPSLHAFSPMYRAKINWKQFNSSSNITFDANDFKDKDIKLYINVTNESELYESLSLLKILYRKDPKSVSVIVPFMEQGTQDRIEFSTDGMETLAQIDTLAKMFGKHKVTTFDIHAEQSLLTFYDLRNVSIVEKLWSMYHNLHPNAIPVFPDDGISLLFLFLEIHIIPPSRCLKALWQIIESHIQLHYLSQNTWPRRCTQCPNGR